MKTERPNRNAATAAFPHRSIAASVGLILAAAQVAQAQTAPPPPRPAAVPKSEMLEEIVVTAQRRAQNVQAIPYNISVVGSDELRRSGTTGLSQLAHIVPGLTAVDAGPAARGNTNDLTLRGLRTDGPGGAGNNGTDVPAQTVNSVSTYFGETPVFFPIALHDIERVEVLRGPQGTLYGSGAQAGTIRFIPKRPSFDAVGGEAGASGSATQGANGKGNGSIDGVLNLPLSAQLALRLVAGDERLAGFINQVALWQRLGPGTYAPATPSVPDAPPLPNYSGPVLGPGKKGTNNSDQMYARAALRWRPGAAWDLQLDYLHQHTTVDDVQTANPTYPGCVVNLAIGQDCGTALTDPRFPTAAFTVPAGGTYDATNGALQPYEDSIDLASLVGTVDMGLASFTSATSFYRDRSEATTEIIGNFVIPGGLNYLDAYSAYYHNYPRPLALEHTPVNENSFTQEIRLVSNHGKNFDYVVGAFYRNQRVSSDTRQFLTGATDFIRSVTGVDPVGNAAAFPDLEFRYDRQTRFIDEAVFGELTYHATSAWQFTAGARFFRQSFDGTAVELIPLADPFTDYGPTIHQSVSDHVIKLNTSYDLSPDTKIYATYSEGFRRGGANALPTSGGYASLPVYQTFAPDLAKNYEAGIKGSALGGRLRYSADVFLIDLDNFQFALANLSGIPGTFNGRSARSKGTELELQARLSERLTATLGHAYTDATVTKSVDLSDLGYCDDGSGNFVYGVCPLVSLKSGALLPGVPKQTLSAALDYQLPLAHAGSAPWSLNFHADLVYRDAAPSVIDPGSRSYWVIPSSTMINAAVSLAAGSAWSCDLFVNNVSNEAGYSGGRGTAQDPLTRQPLPNFTATRVVARPRTVGLRFGYKF
jgi:outer membrane receptor protein involved in Fe transport